ncbi:hypothetical protein Tco_1432236, partial [Tanacetum coccineum]
NQPQTQPDPSLRPSPTIHIPNSILEGSGGNHRGQSSSDRSLSGNEDGLTLQSVYDLCVSLYKQVTAQAKEIKHLKAQIKKLKKKAKPVSTHHKAWMKSVSMKERLAGKKSLKTKWMQKESVSKQKRKPAKDKSTVHKDPTFDTLGTDKSKVSTDKPEVSTAKPKEVEVSTDKLDEGVEIKDAEDSDRPRTTSTRSVLTLKPLPKMDPKDKGKKVLKEEAERKFDQLAKDEEIARKARIEVDRLLAARLQKEEIETFTVEKRAKFLYDTIAVQRRFLAQQRAVAIRSRPPTRTQLINQMMTYLKHIKEMNEESKDPKKKRLKKRVVKLQGKKTQQSTIDSEIMETKSFVSKLHKVSSPDGDYLVVYRQYSKITLEGIELILWGDLKIMMESLTEENDQGDFWNNQQEWEVFRWRLYEDCGVFILELKDGTVIHMLVERRYPLSKELLQRMLDLGLEVEEESTAVLHLVRFIKQQLNEE